MQETWDMNLIPGSGRSPEEGNGNPLQYSCLGDPMDRGAWRATVHRVAKSRTWLGDWAHMQRPKEFKKGWNSLAGHTFPETENSVYCDYCCLQALPSPLLSGASGSLVTVLNRTIRTSCGKAVCTLWRTPSTAGKTLHFFFFSEDPCPFQNVIFPFLFRDRKAKTV